MIRIILQIWILTDEKGIEWRTKQTCQSYLWPLTGDDSREFTARSWWGQLGRRWKADDTKLKGMHETDGSDIILLGLHACVYKEISCAPRLERLLQGNGSVKYAYKDYYKEKTSKPRKRCQPSTSIKAPILSITKICIIHTSFGTLELWEVLTWHSEGIWSAPYRCSLLGLLFLLCRYCFEHVRPCDLCWFFHISSNHLGTFFYKYVRTSLWYMNHFFYVCVWGIIGDIQFAWYLWNIFKCSFV